MARRDSILTTPTSPLAPFPPLPPPELRTRAPEFYGFVAWTSTSLLFVVYLLWAILPDEYIEWLGITWYPSREWAVLLPAYSRVVVFLLAYFVYFALAIHGAPSLSDTYFY
ncbi:PIG-P-domain-containing protein [Armillaria borealis]|uniref:PIG-P-domain-containing protein n=1 Tax=Armillaria borealis TaxID=47425 RepID=A0AA39JM78_9AGAR|nr:PIG-P-domain-containing protein [Armillaria borealis]